ncbi:MAG: DUF3181 family protein [Gomphosphaeria aponina SAG 52.96 = DSM 107014]|uniref:DUF3181 family protein n=1 Tax=Gomphosphaeria aponina SAG 52.96 = DSM 107014 TaxID=1521640 RepID=A0A941GNU8_9CHRO|nr:DUF3181 family protein [Gomphosphaeria aponina SAG 52.96 = DSM 107014]
MANSNLTQEIEKLAAEIGENIYIEVAKWHLYLANAHLHTVVAERVYPLLEKGNFNQAQIEQILADIPVELGGGKLAVPLGQLLPNQCLMNLVGLLEEYQNQR